jgi:hypothetical protein
MGKDNAPAHIKTTLTNEGYTFHTKSSILLICIHRTKEREIAYPTYLSQKLVP